MLPLDLDGLASVIADAVAVSTVPLLERIKSLELAAAARPEKGERGEQGPPGRDVDPLVLAEYRLRVEQLEGEIAALKAMKPPAVDVELIATKAVALMPPPKDGRDAVVDLDALALKAAALVPAPKDGRDGKDGVSVDLPVIKGIVGSSVEEYAAATLVPLLRAEVEKAVSAIPPPKDGKDGEPGPKGDPGERGERGPEGPTGRDGRDGGPGIQGPPGQDGKNGADGAIGPAGPEGPEGKQGERGAPGEDGIGFDDADLVFDATAKRFVLTFTKGERVREFPVPIPIDRGVYSDHETYQKGHMVSRGGSMWLAMLDGIKGIRPDDKTTDGARGWRLCVQRGKEGKEGRQGPQGPPGRDLRWEREE